MMALFITAATYAYVVNILILGVDQVSLIPHSLVWLSLVPHSHKASMLTHTHAHMQSHCFFKCCLSFVLGGIHHKTHLISLNL